MSTGNCLIAMFVLNRCLTKNQTPFCNRHTSSCAIVCRQKNPHGNYLITGNCYLCAAFRYNFKNSFRLMLKKTPSFLLLALLLGTATLQAQGTPKYGHLNLGNLLDLLPDTKKANDDLKVYTDKLTAQDDSLTKAFQAAVAAYQNEYQGGTLTPVQAQAREQELQTQQQSIQKFEQDAQQMVSDQRQKLLEPILTKVNDAIKAVAVENKYLMVFDTSSGAMLYAADSDDIIDLVKKKLGI